MYVCGQVADSIELMLSPLSVDMMSQIISTVSDTMTTANPALIAQRIYFGCTLKHHSQPLNTMPSASFPINSNLIKNSMHISIRLPTADVAIFQSEPALVQEAAPKHQDFTTSAILIHVESSQLNAETEQPPTYFQPVRPASNIVDKKPPEPNVRMPETSSVRKTGQIPSRLQTTCLLRSVHIQFVHLVDNDQYDQNVYSKIPFNCENNWSNQTNSQLRVLCETAIKDIDIQFSLGNSGFGSSPPTNNDNERQLLPKRLDQNERLSTENSPYHSLEIELSTIQVTSVLGEIVTDRLAI